MANYLGKKKGVSKAVIDATKIYVTLGEVGAGYICTDPVAISLAERLAGKANIGLAPYRCEANHFPQFGINQVVILGPADIHEAHSLLEHTKTSQLTNFMKILRNIQNHCCSYG